MCMDLRVCINNTSMSKATLLAYFSTFGFCKKCILVIENCQFVLLEVEGFLVTFNDVLSLTHMGYTVHCGAGGGDKETEHLCVSSPNLITSRLNFTLKAVILYFLYCFFSVLRFLLSLAQHVVSALVAEGVVAGFRCLLARGYHWEF